MSEARKNKKVEVDSAIISSNTKITVEFKHNQNTVIISPNE